MSKFRKKPVIIEAYQWDGMSFGIVEPQMPYFSLKVCKHCNIKFHKHGWIQTLEGGHIVCPGDWVITGVKGEHYPCKPDIFEQTYEEVITVSKKIMSVFHCPKDNSMRNYIFDTLDRLNTHRSTYESVMYLVMAFWIEEENIFDTFLWKPYDGGIVQDSKFKRKL